MIVECSDCGALVDGEVIADYVDYETETDMTGKYSFLKCPKCSNPFIVLQISDGSHWDETTWDKQKRLYPPIEMGISSSIPSSLRSAYEEARTCFRAKAYTATVIMCRKTL